MPHNGGMQATATLGATPSTSEPGFAGTVAPLGKMPGQLRFWRGFHALAGLLAGVALGVVLLGWASESVEGFAAWGNGVAVFAVLALLLAALGWWYGSLSFAHYQASLHAGEGVVLKSGVWWRAEAWVPMARLQHLDVTQGPLDRLWGMATLTLNTAGTHDHSLRIKGLPVAQAHALRAALLPRTRSAHE